MRTRQFFKENIMDTFALKKTLDSSKKIILNRNKKLFDIEQWANERETDLGENIQSTDVESFTGRRFC